MPEIEVLSSEAASAKIDELTRQKSEKSNAIEKRKATFDESEDIQERDDILAEVKGLTEEVEKLDEQIAELEEKREALEKQEKRLSLENNVKEEKVQMRAEENKDMKLEESKEYRSAYVNALKGNDHELRAMTTGMDNVPIPTIMQGFVETAWNQYGKFSRLVTKTYVKGILAIPYEVSADDAVWHDEGAAAPAEEAITLGQVLLQPRSIKKWISLSDELMGMASDEFLRYIADELVYRVIKLLDDSIINGEGKNGAGVIGIVGNALTTAVPAAALSFNTHNRLLAELADVNDVTIAMNSKTFFNDVMGLADTTGRPIYTIMADNAGKPAYYLGGNRVEFTDALKPYSEASAGDVYMIAGNFRGYRLNLPEGETVKVLFDPYSKAPEDLVRNVARLLAAGNVTRLKHFASIAKA